ncbi:MAG: hypothetical protein IID37_02915 [Planctomycetes bacterium]|nr:hypothetical protein [Planctomycetota bacterium]
MRRTATFWSVFAGCGVCSAFVPEESFSVADVQPGAFVGYILSCFGPCD